MRDDMIYLTLLQCANIIKLKGESLTSGIVQKGKYFYVCLWVYLRVGLEKPKEGSKVHYENLLVWLIKEMEYQYERGEDYRPGNQKKENAPSHAPEKIVPIKRAVSKRDAFERSFLEIIDTNTKKVHFYL